jgi:hypothetical protein
MKEGLNMGFLFNNNSLKSGIVSVGLVIVFLILATFLINTLIIILPAGIIGWSLYRVFKLIKGHFFKGKKGRGEVTYKADVVNMDRAFEDLLSNENIIDVEYTEV